MNQSYLMTTLLQASSLARKPRMEAFWAGVCAWKALVFRLRARGASSVLAQWEPMYIWSTSDTLSRLMPTLVRWSPSMVLVWGWGGGSQVRGQRVLERFSPVQSSPGLFPLLALALTCLFVCLGIINSTEHCLAYCMFLDVGTALRMALLLLSQLLCRLPSNYETRSISLVTMNA